MTPSLSRRSVLARRSMAAGLALTSLAAPALRAQALTRATLRLKWLTQAQFAGFDRRLSAATTARRASTSRSTRAGRTSWRRPSSPPAATPSASRAAPTASSPRERNLPIVCIGVAHQVTPFVFVARADGPIKTIEDFKGKKATAWFTGANLVLYAMLASKGIPRDALSITPQQVSVTPFVNGEIDIVAATWYNELNVLKARRAPTSCASSSPRTSASPCRATR